MRHAHIRRQYLLGASLLLAGLVIGSSALSDLLRESHLQLAQASSPPSTNVDEKNSKDTLGPKELAPEPARPSEATTGSSPSGAPSSAAPAQKDALPPAPPEKIGEPITPGGATK